MAIVSQITDSLWMSEKVRDDFFVIYWTSIFTCHCMEDVKGPVKVFTDVENGSYISTSVAIVRSWPDCHQVLVFEPILEAIHDQLMGPCDEFKSIDMVEFRSDFRSKEPSSSSLIHCPVLNFFWVWPHQVTEGSFMRNLHSPFNESNLVHGLDIWWEASMNAKDVPFNHSSDSQVIKDFCAIFPGIGIPIFPNCLIIVSINSTDLSALMVPSQQSNESRILQLQTKQKSECLNRIVTPVHKVTHEDVASVWDFSAFAEEF